VEGDASPAASVPGGSSGIAPRVVPPRVIKSDGTEYPAGGFRLTVRRQDLGTALSFEGDVGVVGVRALIQADGTVESVEIAASSGAPVLDRAAATAVGRWLFAPATRDGVPIEAYVTFKIRYVVR
jgi:TonB family protein